MKATIINATVINIKTLNTMDKHISALIQIIKTTLISLSVLSTTKNSNQEI